MRHLIKRNIGPASLSFPLWAYLLFFFVCPLMLILFYSFGRKPDLMTAHDNSVMSLDRYAEALSPTFIATFWNTLQIGVVGTLACLVIALPVAYLLAIKAPNWFKPLGLALILIPFWTNFLVRTLGWQIFLSPDGPFSAWLKLLGLTHGPLDILYTRPAVLLGVVYNYLPLMILPLFVSIDKAGPALREASRDLGAGRWKTFFAITFPLAAPGIASGMLLVYIPLMGDYLTASVLGGAQGNMVGQMIAQQFNVGQNWALGSAMSVTLMLLIALTIAIAAILILAVRIVIKQTRKIDTRGWKEAAGVQPTVPPATVMSPTLTSTTVTSTTVTSANMTPATATAPSLNTAKKVAP